MRDKQRSNNTATREKQHTWSVACVSLHKYDYLIKKYNRDEQVNTHSSPKPKNVITMMIILPIA